MTSISMLTHALCLTDRRGRDSRLRLRLFVSFFLTLGRQLERTRPCRVLVLRNNDLGLEAARVPRIRGEGVRCCHYNMSADVEPELSGLELIPRLRPRSWRRYGPSLASPRSRDSHVASVGRRQSSLRTRTRRVETCSCLRLAR